MDSEAYVTELITMVYDQYCTDSNINGAILILPSNISVKETQYCVGQAETLVTVKGFESLIRRDWTCNELINGSNYIVCDVEHIKSPFNFRFMRRNRWAYDPRMKNASIILPYVITRVDTVETILKSRRPAVAYAADVMTDNDDTIRFSKSLYPMNVFL